MRKQGRAVEQLSVHVKLGDEPIMSMVFSTETSKAMLDSLDGSREDVDAMLTTALGMAIASIYMLPMRWVLEPLAMAVDAGVERLAAEMGDEGNPDLPF